MGITHAFVNPKADGPDTTITRPSDWNAGHVINLDVSDIPAGIARISVTNSDPGAVGAGALWLTLTGNLSVRNGDDTGWIALLSAD